MALVMKFPGNSIIPETLHNVRSEAGSIVGYGFDIKLRYYRGHYLSCTETFEIRIDGQPVNPDLVTLSINNKSFPIKLLPELISEFWLVTEPAKIFVHQLGGLEPGEHEIDLMFMLRSPYMPNPDPTAPNRYVPIDNSSSDRQTVV